MKATERLSYERLTRMLEHHREQGRLEGERAEKERCLNKMASVKRRQKGLVRAALAVMEIEIMRD